MHVTALYAAPLALLFLALSIRVIALRRSARVSLGDGGDTNLLRRVRVQANFAEYVPLALVLLGLAETLTAPVWFLHVCGLALVAGRMCHAMGVSRTDEDFRMRVAGVALTATPIGVLALADFALAIG